MPSLHFKGKVQVVNHHLAVPFHALNADRKKSVLPGDANPSLHDNLIIHGDNLLALKALLPTHAGKVNCIYIDPPYNTGKEGWCYNDKVNNPMMKEWLGKVVDAEDLTRHDKWLCMMWPRLELLRELLAEDGVIFVSIDDNEQHRLRAIMDEVFGDENSLSLICWQGMDTIKNDAKYFSSNAEFILCYAKNIERVKIKGFKKTEKQNKKYKNRDNDPRGPYLLTPLHAKSGTESNVYDFRFPSGQVWRPPEGRYPTYSKSKLKQLLEDNRLWLDPKGVKTPQRKTYLSEVGDRMRPHTFWRYEDFGSTRQANADIREIFGRGGFANSKPTSLIRAAIDLIADKDSIILDSFAGSGTTAQAVLELNKEDDGNRKFILVECEDYANKTTAERVRRVIRGVKTAKDESLKNGLGGTFGYWRLGEALEIKSILDGKDLPPYEELARYIFFTATGEQWVKKSMRKPDFFIGESRLYEVYLFYKPNIAYLQKTSFTLDAADKLPPAGEKWRLVFAPTRYAHIDELGRRKIKFAQLPFEIYRIANK